ncbi:hypothetical protein Tco_0127934 [Tanacetum coccineum]
MLEQVSVKTSPSRQNDLSELHESGGLTIFVDIEFLPPNHHSDAIDPTDVIFAITAQPTTMELILKAEGRGNRAAFELGYDNDNSSAALSPVMKIDLNPCLKKELRLNQLVAFISTLDIEERHCLERLNKELLYGLWRMHLPVVFWLRKIITEEIVHSGSE